MESGKVRIELESLAVVPDRSFVIPMLSHLVRHDLMHAGRFRSHQRQSQHGFAGKIRINPVGGVEHFDIRWDIGVRRALTVAAALSRSPAPSRFQSTPCPLSI